MTAPREEHGLRKLCVDICSGKGGFSQRFKNQLDWEVVTIDIERKFKPTIVADVCNLPLREGLEIDVLLASPPCERFSIACPKWPKEGIQKALEIVGACFETVAHYKPKLWLIENPKGRLRWFVGMPKQTIRYSDYDINYPCNKLTDFWGNIPFPMVKHERPLHSGHFDSGWMKKHAFDRALPRDASSRAKIPEGVSSAVFQSVEGLMA